MFQKMSQIAIIYKSVQVASIADFLLEPLKQSHALGEKNGLLHEQVAFNLYNLILHFKKDI